MSSGFSGWCSLWYVKHFQLPSLRGHKFSLVGLEATEPRREPIRVLLESSEREKKNSNGFKLQIVIATDTEQLAGKLYRYEQLQQQV